MGLGWVAYDWVRVGVGVEGMECVVWCGVEWSGVVSCHGWDLLGWWDRVA